MKALYIGSLGPSSTARFYAKALRDLGLDVTTFDPQFFRTHTPFQQLLVRAKKAPLLERVDVLNRQIQRLSRENDFDLVLVIGENYLTPETLNEFKRLYPTRLIYHSHDNIFFEGILKPPYFFETLRLYDVVFTTKSQNVSRYQALGIKNAQYIPAAYEPSVHRPVSVTNQRRIVFVGTFAASRTKYLKILGWQNLSIYGNNWNRYTQYLLHRNAISPTSIYNDDYASTLCSAQVALGLMREEAQDLHTQRTFEIPACGVAQVAPKNAEILQFFDEGREIYCFESPEELKEKTDFLLRHPSECQRLAQAGFRRVQSGAHTYRDRTRNFLATL